jgi:predicted DNA-binding transcriptional regulator YafY
MPGPQSDTVDPQALTIMASACRDRERLRFRYKARQGEQTRREAEPHSLVNLGRRWYLVAWDCGREDWRTFRVDRLERPESTGVRFDARELPGRKDAAKYVSENLSSARQRYEARVTLHCPASRMKNRPWLQGQIEPIDDTTCEYRSGDDNLDWLAIRIAMLGVEFEVHEPPELVDTLRALSARVDRATAANVKA